MNLWKTDIDQFIFQSDQLFDVIVRASGTAGYEDSALLWFLKLPCFQTVVGYY